MSRVLVTGGTGFIGAPTVELLFQRGHEVHLVTRGDVGPPGTIVHRGDLHNPATARSVCTTLRPSHLLHLAWYTEPGRFWNDVDANLRWVETSLRLTRAFLETEGRHMVAVGTAAEPVAGLEATSVYAAAKHALHTTLAAAVTGDGASLTWARLFQPYGPGEPPARLLPAAARSLRSGHRFQIRTAGSQYRDFIHVQDVASALVALLENEAPLVADIGTGVGTAVRDAVLHLAHLLGAEDRVDFGDAPLPVHELQELVADTSAVRALGWSPRVSLADGLAELIAE